MTSNCLAYHRPYTYCDTEGDTELASFALTDDDLVFKIPYIKQAQQMSDREVQYTL